MELVPLYIYLHNRTSDFGGQGMVLILIQYSGCRDYIHVMDLASGHTAAVSKILFALGFASALIFFFLFYLLQKLKPDFR